MPLFNGHVSMEVWDARGQDDVGAWQQRRKGCRAGSGIAGEPAGQRISMLKEN